MIDPIREYTAFIKKHDDLSKLLPVSPSLKYLRKLLDNEITSFLKSTKKEDFLREFYFDKVINSPNELTSIFIFFWEIKYGESIFGQIIFSKHKKIYETEFLDFLYPGKLCGCEKEEDYPGYEYYSVYFNDVFVDGKCFCGQKLSGGPPIYECSKCRKFFISSF